MTTHAEVLAAQRLFADLPAETVAAIGEICSDVRFEPGDWVLREGQPAEVFYVLTTGRVALEISSSTQPALVIETLTPGEIVGLSWMLPGHHWTFDARAVEASTALAVDGRRLLEMCDADAELGYTLYRRFAALTRSRLQATRVQLLDLYGRER